MAEIKVTIECEPPITVEISDPKTDSCYLARHAADVVERTLNALAAFTAKDTPDAQP